MIRVNGVRNCGGDERNSAGDRLHVLSLCALSFAFGLMLPAAAAGQEPDPLKARFQVGPFAMTPTIRFEVGMDTNVFNQAAHPQRDLATEFRPQFNTWLRLGRGHLNSITSVGLVHYRQFATERAVNARNDLRFELPLNRVKPWASTLALTGRERINFDLDERVRRVEVGVATGVDVRAAAKWTVGTAVRLSRIDFDESQTHVLVDPRETLNRSSRIVSGTVRRALTPLTSLVFAAESQHDEFELSPIRNTDSVRFTPGVEFSPFALLNGKAYVGYRSFQPISGAIPPFQGLVGAAQIGMTIRTLNRVSITAERDVDYGADVVYPYFVVGGVTGSLLRQLGDRWQVGGTLGRHRLAYQAITTAPRQAVAGVPDQRTETVRRLGGTIGYRLSPKAVLSFNIDTLRRSSAVPGRDYDGARVTSNLTYTD